MATDVVHHLTRDRGSTVSCGTSKNYSDAIRESSDAARKILRKNALKNRSDEANEFRRSMIKRWCLHKVSAKSSAERARQKQQDLLVDVGCCAQCESRVSVEVVRRAWRGLRARCTQPTHVTCATGRGTDSGAKSDPYALFDRYLLARPLRSALSKYRLRQEAPCEGFSGTPTLCFCRRS